MDSGTIALAGDQDITISEKCGIPEIVEFYEKAGEDYLYWSKGYNMHLGYYRRGLNPFDRESMIEQLNLEIGARLKLGTRESKMLIDLGCGTGATARSLARKYSDLYVNGFTISPSQVRIAAEMNRAEDLHGRINVIEANYISLPIAEKVADGAWAIESACYANGSDKVDLIIEMARVLKSGACFVVADCFIKKPQLEFGGLVRKCYSAVCRNWALTEMPVLDHFVAAAEKNGFRDILVEDVSWRTAPSLAHAPVAVLGFILNKLMTGKRLERHSINNLAASLLAIVLGANRSKFSYCIVSGTRV